jgi:hypothetical protein
MKALLAIPLGIFGYLQNQKQEGKLCSLGIELYRVSRELATLDTSRALYHTTRIVHNTVLQHPVALCIPILALSLNRLCATTHTYIFI